MLIVLDSSGVEIERIEGVLKAKESVPEADSFPVPELGLTLVEDIEVERGDLRLYP